MPEEIWVSYKETVGATEHRWPCVFDHKRDYSTSYTRTDLITAEREAAEKLYNASKALGNIMGDSIKDHFGETYGGNLIKALFNWERANKVKS